ncbi:uncharacterized protein LOC126845536 [Adelges cooleyi]|uniref:uncharacterized protein LOC126845536 n=1 Tax=Adelges cooleyi TaxID=133065 RepID=UPI0021804797|nr:uncharacterized protein LOC126845536 [Adelges cooleyi]
MINIKIFILLFSLTAYVACSGSNASEEEINDHIIDTPQTEESVVETNRSEHRGEEKSQTSTKSQGQKSNNASSQERGVSCCGLQSLWSKIKNIPCNNCLNRNSDSQTFNQGDELYEQMYNNRGNTGYAVYNQGNKCAEFFGETLVFDGKIVEGVNATERPLVIKWGNRALEVNGERKIAFKGIRGSGTMNF